VEILKLALLALAVLTAYCALALVKPHRKCSRCKGSPRRSKRWLGLFGPMGVCRRCGGQRRHQRRGARVIHSYFWLAIGHPIRERRKQTEGQTP
jgi:predicted amidophosphoribosyltransferase